MDAGRGQGGGRNNGQAEQGVLHVHTDSFGGRFEERMATILPMKLADEQAPTRGDVSRIRATGGAAGRATERLHRLLARRSQAA
jgi:hypothetical protein